LSSTQHISQEDLILYSMQALSPVEQDQAKAHLETCAACRGALAEVLADVALIGLSAPQQEIPEGARERFMAAIADTPQTSGTAAQPAAESPEAHPYPIGGRRQRGGLGWFGWITALAALVVAVYLGVHSLQLQRRLDESRGEIAGLSAQAARAQELMEALTSPAARQVTLTETKRPAQPVGHATYLKKSGALIFIANNLHPVPQNKTYELWLIPANGKAPIPAGLFRPDSSGAASVVLPQLPAGIDAKAFGVTVEPAQGSTTPTLPIVMAGQ
jgi:Anti-sigma-K factor rskA, C-terminal/Putative zinc-finger